MRRLKPLGLFRLQKRRSRVNAVQFYRTSEVMNKADAVVTAVLQLQNVLRNH